MSSKRKKKKLNYFLIDIEPHRLKTDTKLLANHLAERRLPIEQRELEIIARNTIENLINTERKYNCSLIFLNFLF